MPAIYVGHDHRRHALRGGASSPSRRVAVAVVVGVIVAIAIVVTPIVGFPTVVISLAVVVVTVLDIALALERCPSGC